jgi:hypothetical protein
MRPGEVRLGVDCGSTSTVAVLVWPDGCWVRLLFDGAPQLASAVHVDVDGALATGARAWQQASVAPEGFVPAPLRRLREGRFPVGTGEVDVVDLVAAMLRRVGAEATKVAGGPVADVRLVVPAGWGPRQRTLMRQAAHRAGLGQCTLVEAPVAAAEHLVASGTRILVGSFVVVCDVGGGFEATVLRRTPTGFDVLATVDDPDAGGLRIDEVLADRVAAFTGVPAGGPDPAAPLSDGERLTLLANVGTAKETLAQSVSVAVALPPPRPAVVLDSAQLEAAARPILAQAAKIVGQAVDAAEIEAGQLAGVYCIGGGAAMPLAVRVLGEETGLSPVVVDEPQLAAALGAVQAHGPAGAADQSATGAPVVALPSLRRVAGMLVPGLASLALMAHFLSSAELNRTHSRGFYDPNAYVLANWGELAMAAAFALITCLAAATVLASTLPSQDRTPPPATSGDVGQIGSGLLAAVALGLTVGGLYAVGGSVYFDLPNGPFLRWALLPVLPIAAAVTITAVLATRWGRTPARGWHGWLNFPAGSVLCAAAGMLLVQVSMTAKAYPSHALLIGLAGRGGALLLGLGAALAALAVVASPRYRMILAAPLAVFCAAIVSWPATGMLGGMYVAAATLWWLQRVWDLVRQPGRPHPRTM